MPVIPINASQKEMDGLSQYRHSEYACHTGRGLTLYKSMT